MLFRNRASSNLYQSQIANLKKGRLILEGSLIIKGNYYYAKFRVNGKQKMIATKIPVKGNNKRRAEQKMKERLSRQMAERYQGNHKTFYVGILRQNCERQAKALF